MLQSEFDKRLAEIARKLHELEANLAKIARQLQERYHHDSAAAPSDGLHMGMPHPKTIVLPVTLENQEFGNEIASLSEEEYSRLTSTTPNAAKLKKVLATVVMKKNNTLSLVALGTGTKCIRGCHLSQHGDAVNDCHAEVVARRAFVKYLYTQLKHCVEERKSIFTKAPTSGKCMLKDDISFHLYISTAPCGDARVFGTEPDTHPNRASRGLARVKREAGRQVLPPKEVPVWKSLTEGRQRLCTMSCSDKLARWNVLGVQGSLLSIYIDPIYFASITLGSAFSREHLQRAVYTRVGTISDLPDRYMVKCPILCDGSPTQAISHAKQKNLKFPKSSFNWYSEKGTSIETIDCDTGRLLQDATSRLCKHSLFLDFLQLWDKLVPDEFRGMLTAKRLQMYCSYGQVKYLAGDYQVAKKKLFNCYTSCCGSPWVEKPHQQDYFQ